MRVSRGFINPPLPRTRCRQLTSPCAAVPPAADDVTAALPDFAQLNRTFRLAEDDGMTYICRPETVISLRKLQALQLIVTSLRLHAASFISVSTDELAQLDQALSQTDDCLGDIGLQIRRSIRRRQNLFGELIGAGVLRRQTASPTEAQVLAFSRL